MKLPPDSIVAPEKLSGYLLIFRADDDKSRFLALAGYTLADASRLERDMREQLLPLEAEPIDLTPHGQKYLIRGPLRGPNGRSLRVVSIWMTLRGTGTTKFVTLYPDRK